LNADNLFLESKIDQGLKLQVQNISMSDKNTSIKFVLLSEDPTVSIAANWWNNLVIRNSQGEMLEITSQPITTFEDRNEVVIETEPMLSDEIYQINFSGPINLIKQVDQGNAFVLDFEKESYVGQVWRLDHDCNFGSHQCKINQAEVIQGAQERLNLSEASLLPLVLIVFGKYRLRFYLLLLSFLCVFSYSNPCYFSSILIILNQPSAFRNESEQNQFLLRQQFGSFKVAVEHKVQPYAKCISEKH
jgi:hypothetical protein